MAEIGNVKWYDEVKGVGMIVRPRGADVMVLRKDIKGEGFKTLNPGQRVSYDVVEGPKGMMAVNVVPL
jgi:CspA family cold shock protein